METKETVINDNAQTIKENQIKDKIEKMKINLELTGEQFQSLIAIVSYAPINRGSERYRYLINVLDKELSKDDIILQAKSQILQ